MATCNLIRSLTLLFVLITSGCAAVSVYDENGKNQGVRFHTSKPYLMVTRTGAKDKPAEVQIVHIPDLENPQFAKVRFGIGNAKLSLKISNGSLSEFGGEGDGQADELLSAITGGFKTVEEALLIHRTDPGEVEEEQATQTQVDLVRTNLQDLLEQLQEDIRILGDMGSVDNQIQAIFDANIPRIRAAIEILERDPLSEVQVRLPGVIEILNEFKVVLTRDINRGGMDISNNTTNSVQNYRTAISRHRAEIQSSINALGGNEKKPMVELYEINFADGAISLRRVDIPEL